MRALFSFLAATVVTFGTGFSPLKAEFTKYDLAPTGLVLNWEANIGGSPLVNGAESLKFWAHTTQKNEVVRFYANGKLIKTFRADDIDDKQLEEAILSGKSEHEAPRLGLAGATQKAESLSKLYQKIGRKTDIQTEVSKAYYAAAVSDTGVITLLNSETGGDVWRRQLPSPDLPILGPAISDDYVAVLNGQEYFVYKLLDGALVTRNKLSQVATGKPVIYGKKLGVPSTGGRLLIYDIQNPRVAEQLIRIGSENRIGTTRSSDSEFLSWPMESKFVVVKLENPPLVWYTFDAGFGSELPSIPITVPGGFLVASLNGTVSRLNLDRNNPLEWKSRIGTTCNQSPVVGLKNAAVVGQDGRLFLLDLSTGEHKWPSPIRGIESALTVTDKHVYAMDSARNLVTIDAVTAQIKSRVFVGNRTAVPNSSTDRIVLADQFGTITCLREPESQLPILVAPFTPKLTDEEKAALAKSAAKDKAKTPDAEASADEFDTSEFEDDKPATTEPEETEEDPFGAF